jgi:peptidoglycan/LPS O-acetylase OafA/YrhL
MIYATQLPGTLDNFVVGIALALVKIHSPGHKWLAQSGRVFAAWLVVALLVSALWWVVFWPKKYYWTYPDMIVFWRTLLAVASGAWLAVFITCPRQTHWITSPLRYLGRISYGIYLWHMPILLALKNVMGANQYLLLAWVLSATLLMSALSWHAFEQRLSKLGRSS